MDTIGGAGGQLENLSVGGRAATPADEINGERKSKEQCQKLRTKIASYEAREDEFLTEIERMRRECSGDETANTPNGEGTAQKLANGGEAPTMLGKRGTRSQIMITEYVWLLFSFFDTLCTLIGEIGKLRRENRRLRRRFAVPEMHQQTENQPQPKNARGVSSLPRRFLPNIACGSSAFSCFPLQSSSASCSSAVSSLFSGSDRPPFGKMFGRPSPQAQSERLSSPPPPVFKKSVGSLLTVSAYSADLSSDASLNRRRILEGDEVGGEGGQNSQRHFAWEVQIEKAKETTPKGLKPRRGMARRAEMQKPPKAGDQQGKQLLCLSTSVTSGTSPVGSSSSACSSVEPTLSIRPQNNAQNRADLSSTEVPMSASRCSSLLDLFGIRRRKPSPSSNSSAEGSNRAMGTFSNMMDSLTTRRTAETNDRSNRKFGVFASGTNRRHSQHLQYLGDEPSPPYSPAVSPICLDGYSSGEMAKKLGGKPKVVGQRQKMGNARMESEPNLLKNWHKSNESVLAVERSGLNKQRKGRPRSCFLGPPQSESGARDRRQRTENGKTAETKARFTQRTTSLEQELCLEMQLLRARNAQLIGQLRDKSGQLSMAETRADKLGRELQQMQAKKRLDASLGKECVRKRMANAAERAIGELKDHLCDSFLAQLQSLKFEAQRHQQMTLNASRCDRESLRESMAEVERLKHENCALLQKQAKVQRDEDEATELCELLNSYDALYAFAAGNVRKMGQMRERMAEKNAELFCLELESVQSQSQALLAQTNCEWLRVQIRLLMANASGAFGRPLIRRPASYHGQSLTDRMINFGNLRQQMILPFKLIAQRIRQQRAKQKPTKWNESPDVANRFDALMEENEQNIELEFLRLFKSARNLARICGGNENNGQEAETTEWAKATEKVVTKLTENAKSDEGISVPPFSVGFSFSSQIEETRQQQQKRTIQSEFGTDLREKNQLIFGDFSGQNGQEMCPISPPKMRRKSVQQLQQNDRKSPLHSPMAKFRRLSAIFGGWSARVEANVSPPPPLPVTPVVIRRVPLPNSPQHRRHRPPLTRQFSINCPKDSSLPSHSFISPHFLAGNATENKNCFSVSVPFYESLTPMIGSSVDAFRRRPGQPPPPKQRPNPSAPPLSVPNLATLSRLPQPNLSGVSTSSTRRPLSRTRASESPSKQERSGGILAKCQDKEATNGQMSERQSTEERRNPVWSKSRIGPESRSSSASRLPKAIGQNAKKEVPSENLKAAKKAGISWLGRLRRKEGQKPSD